MKIRKLIILLISFTLISTIALASKDYDYITYIGRFQPFHKGHEYTVKKALKLANTVIILCGSANLERSLKNPWDYNEREEMIRSCFTPDENQRLVIKPLNDFPGDDNAWIKNVKLNVDNSVIKAKAKIGLIGYFKDSSSYYLNLFPKWELIHIDNYNNINATPIRKFLFEQKKVPDDFKQELPEAVIKYLNNHKFILNQ